MTAEQYLDQIKKIDSMIRNKLRDYNRWLELAEGLGGASVGERVQSTRNLHRGADAIGNYIDIDREIDALKAERFKIIRNIEGLPFDEYEVIYMLYVGEYDKAHDTYIRYTMKEIAYLKKKSYDWVKRRKGNGLKLLQAVLDGAESGDSPL